MTGCLPTPEANEGESTEQRMRELLAGLREASCYPGNPTDVQLIQTHLSIVCLAGDRVFKLKKAITLPFVDFAPLTARRQACRDEVRLNRRLCPNTYLGTASLRRVPGGLRFAAIGDDEHASDIDVAVVMQRLPQARMLDELVASGSVTPADMQGLAQMVAAFHRAANTGPAVLEYGSPQKLAAFADANFTELQQMEEHGLSRDLLSQLQRESSDAFAMLMPELQIRAANHRVVDGHGDLHARNVCMTDPPTIYDCIEFEPAFRCGDVATEVAFLAMDLRYRKAPELARAFVRAYVESSGDDRLPALLPPLCSYRAMVRAKVAALASSESELSAADREHARCSAQQHLMLASAYAIEAHGPWWLLVCGPPASGKSRLCRELSENVQWPHYATDVVRKQLAGIGTGEPARPEHYTEAFSQRTYDELLARACAATKSGTSCVMLDGNFPTPAHRQLAQQSASTVGAQLAVLFVGVDSITARQRAAHRQNEAGNVSDADPAITAALHAAFIAPTTAESDFLVSLDGAAATCHLAEQVLTALLARGRCGPGGKL